MLSWRPARPPRLGGFSTMRRFLPLLVSLVLVAVLAAGCGGGGDDGKGGFGGQGQNGACKKKLEPGSIAVVCNDQITQADFDLVLSRAKKTYKDQNRPFPKAGSTEYQKLVADIVDYLFQGS